MGSSFFSLRPQAKYWQIFYQEDPKAIANALKELLPSMEKWHNEQNAAEFDVDRRYWCTYFTGILSGFLIHQDIRVKRAALQCMQYKLTWDRDDIGIIETIADLQNDGDPQVEATAKAIIAILRKEDWKISDPTES